MTTDKPKRPKKVPDDKQPKSRSAESTGWVWADPNDLKVNAKFQRLIPLQSREEYRALRESIKDDGCRDPLLIWKGHKIVLDGHTRRDLCIQYEKKVKVQEIELEDEKAATEFILRIQRQRRNLTREAMSYFRGTDYNSLKQLRGGNRRGSKGQSGPLNSTAKQLADKYGVSEKTIKRDGVFAHIINKIVEEYGDPELKRSLLGADVKLTHGLARFLFKMSPDKRKPLVERLIETGEFPREKKEKRTAVHQPKQVAQSLVARLKVRGDEHARAVLEQMAKLLGLAVSEKAPND